MTKKNTSETEKENTQEQTSETTNKENTSEKPLRVRRPLKEEVSPEEFRKLLVDAYRESNDKSEIVHIAVGKITSKLQKPLKELIDLADKSLYVNIFEDEGGEKRTELVFDLTSDELAFLAIKIPVMCLYLQDFVNARALDATVAEHFAEQSVTENLKKEIGGDAKERMRFAQQEAEIEYLVSIIKKQVYTNLKTYIDRADKVYEGVKKVLDGRDKELRMTQKANKFGS